MLTGGNWCCRMLQVANHRCVLCVANHMFGDAAGANCWGGRTVGVLVPWNAFTLAIAAIATRETHVQVPGKVQYSRPQVLFENEVGCNVCTVEMWCDYFSLCKSRSSAVQAAYNDRLQLSSSIVSTIFPHLNCWMLVYMTKFRQKNFTWASWATGAACATNRGFVNSDLHSLCLRVLAGFVHFVQL